MKRGCGTRVEGGLYACCDTAPWGRPIEDFLVDPAQPITTEPFRAPQMIERDGKNHLLMWVGEENYPTVPDFVEEARLHGISKRIPDNFPIEKLSMGSMMFLVHRNVTTSYSFHAWLVDVLNKASMGFTCPKGKKDHEEPEVHNLERCLGMLWPLASLCGAGREKHDGPLVMRKVGDTRYSVMNLCPLVGETIAEYNTGVFGVFPITSFQYVRKNRELPEHLSAKCNHTDIPVLAMPE